MDKRHVPGLLTGRSINKQTYSLTELSVPYHWHSHRIHHSLVQALHGFLRLWKQYDWHNNTIKHCQLLTSGDTNIWKKCSTVCKWLQKLKFSAAPQPPTTLWVNKESTESRIVKIMPLWFLVSWQWQVHAWKMQHDIDGRAEPAAAPHTRHICALYYAAEG